LDQWRYSPEVHDRAVASSIDRHELWVVDTHDNDTIGTITLNEYADPETADRNSSSGRR
jgi:hypothetical protein